MMMIVLLGVVLEEKEVKEEPPEEEEEEDEECSCVSFNVIVLLGIHSQHPTQRTQTDTQTR